MGDSSFSLTSVSLKRHPETRSSANHNRILKIQFPDSVSRDRFLRQSRSIRAASLTGNPHAFLHRDFTMEELARDRELRREAGRRNSEANELLWVVRDLSLHKLSIPRPLPPRSAAHRDKLIQEGKMGNPSLPPSLLSNLMPPLSAQFSQSRGRAFSRGGRGRGTRGATVSASRGAKKGATSSASNKRSATGGTDPSLPPKKSNIDSPIPPATPQSSEPLTHDLDLEKTPTPPTPK